MFQNSLPKEKRQKMAASRKQENDKAVVLHVPVQTQRGVDDKIPLDSDIIPWIARWAEMCYSRFDVGRDGETAWEKVDKKKL